MASPYLARDWEDPFSGHRNAIEEMGYIDNEIVAAFTQQELISSERSLQRRL
jgi:hypothetical protein